LIEDRDAEAKGLRLMKITDNGPEPNVFDIETATRENANYRTVAWSGKYLQVTLMSIPVGESIGLEVHPETDQFLRLDAGRGRAKMGPSKDELTFQQDVADGWSIQVPAGTWHDVENTGDEPMRLYAVYAPVHHAPGLVQQTADEAKRDEESGADEPPAWSVEPEGGQADDEHA
jgi:mannose-6-phosphate isomerase-like protein (cupin superfamily)